MPTTPHHHGHEDSPKHSFMHGEPAEDVTRAKASDDRDTIVDMSLRVERFILCVSIALAFAFAFAIFFVTYRRKTLTYIYESELVDGETMSSKASAVVENYNTISGYLQFMGSSIFMVFCETLIFPSLATYLHNCSLYPGDQPARVHSVNKERSIFWGLKTVIILMNVGFTSVYVGKENVDTPSRRLTTPDELPLRIEPPMIMESDVQYSILRTSMTGVTTPFEFQDSCKWHNQDNSDAHQQWGAWADDVDTTSVSFSFPSHAWNMALLPSKTVAPTSAVEIPLQDFLVNRKKYAMTNDFDPAELYSTFQQGLSKLGLATGSVGISTAPQSFDDLVHVVASALKAAMPSNTQVGNLVLRLERRELAEDVRLTSLTVSIPVDQDNVGTTRCGATGCVYATSASVLETLRMQPGVSIASYEQDKSALVYSVGNQYVQGLAASQTPHEVLTLSMGKLSWDLSPLHIRHVATCADDGEQQCLGLSLPFATGDGVLLVGKDALATQHVTRPVALVTLHSAAIPDMTRLEDEVLTSWNRVVSANGMLVRPSRTANCDPLVDSYLSHIETNHFFLDGQSSQDMYSAALFYLLQRGVPTSYSDLMSRRRLALSASSSSSSGSGNGATTDIEVNVPTAMAVVTLTGCIFIVLLMLCVVFLPTSRVKLSPDTTPAAQYVQILTDDLYPDIVHKKRLRFANGDCLLFNEYVVNAIVLHAKRDQTKKIYL